MPMSHHCARHPALRCAARTVERTHAAVHRQQELFVVVDAAVGVDAAFRDPVRRGDGPLRRLRGELQVQAAHRTGGAHRARAGAGGRRPGGVGHAGDRRVPGRTLATTRAVAARCARSCAGTQPVRGDACRVFGAAQRLPAEHRGVVARDRPPRAARAGGRAQRLAAIANDVARGAAGQRWPVSVWRISASPTPTSRRWLDASAPTNCPSTRWCKVMSSACSPAPRVSAWVREALAERDFLDFEEPYRTSRDG